MNLFLYIDLNFSFNFGHYYNIFTNIYSACSNESDMTLVHSDWKHYDDSLSDKFNDFPNLSRVFVNRNNDYIERIIAEIDFESYENIVIYVYKGGVDFIEPLSKLSDHLDLIKSKFEIWNTLFLFPFDQLKLKSNTFKSKFVKEIKFSKSLLNNRPIKLCFDVENSIWNKYFDEVSFLPPPLLKDDKFIDKKPYSGDTINIAIDVWNLRHAPKFRNEKIENLKKLIFHLCNTFSNILIHIKIADSSFIIDEEKDRFFTSNPQIKIIRFLTQSAYESFIENTDIYILQYSPTFYKNKSSGHFLELIKHNIFIIGTKNTFLEDNSESEEYLYNFGDSTSLISVTSAAITNKAYLTNYKPKQKHKRLLRKWSKDYFKNTLITQTRKNKNTKSKIKRTNKPFIVLGNGPSLKDFDFDKLNGHDTIGMNAAYRYWDKINWYPTYYICLDTVVVKSHHEEIKRLVDNSENLGIKKFFVRKELFELQSDLKLNPKVVTYEQMKSENPLAFDCIHVTTGSFAARFAIYEGYESIILLGIDETYINFIKESKLKEKITLEITDTPNENPNYFFADYQQKGDLYQIANHSKVYKCNCKHCNGDIRNGETLHVDAWKFLEDDINNNIFTSRYGQIQIVNCNRKSAVKFFPFADFDQAVVNLSKNTNDLVSLTKNEREQPTLTQIDEKIIFPMISFFGTKKLIEKDSILASELHNLSTYKLKITLKSFYNRSSFETYGNSSPPMPFIIGPFALLDLGSRYKVSVQQHDKSVDLVEFENTFTWFDIEFQYKKNSQELIILVDGKQIRQQEIQLLEVPQKKISLGCGFYQRYWKGEIESIELSNLETGTIPHHVDLKNITNLLIEVSDEDVPIIPTCQDTQSEKNEDVTLTPNNLPYILDKSIKFHSSNETNQDMWVVETLKGKREGFFIDLGASDGKSANNTLTLEESFNWNGILIEGNEKSYKLLEKNRSNQICLNEIISDKVQDVSWRDNNVMKTRSGIDTTLPAENAVKSWRVGDIITRKSQTLENILIEYSSPKSIDLLAIDIEGGEVNALTNFPFDKYQIKLLTIEIIFTNIPIINKIMAEAGYTKVNNPYNTASYEHFYVKEDLL